MENLYGLVADAVDKGQTLALAMLVHAEGSTPREPGTKMVVYPDGRTELRGWCTMNCAIRKAEIWRSAAA